MKRIIFLSLLQFLSASLTYSSFAQSAMNNIPGRKTVSLNGRWGAIIDLYDAGSGKRAFWKDLKPEKKTDFYEYSFENGPVLNVPGDFNTQLPELNYYEGSVWYKKNFIFKKVPDKRVFLYFGAANYKTDAYLNSQTLGSHEGGFTPFQFEITDKIKDGQNSVIVRVNNQRLKDAVPTIGFDWFNYGGITRDVDLVVTPESYIKDYFIQLEKGKNNFIKGWIKIDGTNKNQTGFVEIAELKIKHKFVCDSTGAALFAFAAKPVLWSPEKPKLYDVKIISQTDTISEQIGFRNIDVRGDEILLNGRSVFLKGVNIHEELPERGNRAYSKEDAELLLGRAKELGCNFVRLAHYPHNENMVRLADKLGLMVWSEIPVYQKIEFQNPAAQQRMNNMLKEMIARDKNRASVIIWSISNETVPSKERNANLSNLAQLAKELDSTRLISSAMNLIKYEKDVATIDDSLCSYLDVIGVNEYYGWYKPWPAAPGEMIWKSDFKKPLIMSEFGGEATYGNHDTLMTASTWSEEYQEQIYKDQIKMLKTIPFLRGTCPWILADFKSPVRVHPVYQKGYNRKGLLSDKGLKKKAWYVMKEFYESMK